MKVFALSQIQVDHGNAMWAVVNVGRRGRWNAVCQCWGKGCFELAVNDFSILQIYTIYQIQDKTTCKYERDIMHRIRE